MGVDESPNEIEIDSEGNELSEKDSFERSGGRGNGTAEPQTHPTPEEINRTIEPPLGNDGDKLVEKQGKLKPGPQIGWQILSTCHSLYCSNYDSKT